MILDVIVEDKKKRLIEDKNRAPFEEVKREALKLVEADAFTGGRFYEALAKEELSIIGEFKKASPSLGNIKKTMELTDRIDDYNASVDCISCLTEQDHFLGNIDYFKQIRAISNLPMIRKDFMIDEYQFYEAKLIGADAILLIAAILDDAQMKDFYQLAESLHLDALVEVHDEKEMERALKIDPRIVGVNNRDLRDFTIRLDNTKRLSPMVPEGKVFVAESGIVEDDDVRFLKECNVNAFLIGRAFMESENPKEKAKHWKNIYAEA
ncbi:MAG: indole-3-glycerol phosphate synthase TrpC [Eubacterium sp.]|nr:indole-3-glycerol phosphate synthase TrpC [Eubacterium sp.]